MVDDGAPTVMFGLDGLELVAVSERDDELEQAVQTPGTVVSCSSCGSVTRVHARRPVWVRDLPAGVAR